MYAWASSLSVVYSEQSVVRARRASVRRCSSVTCLQLFANNNIPSLEPPLVHPLVVKILVRMVVLKRKRLLSQPPEAQVQGLGLLEQAAVPAQA